MKVCRLIKREGNMKGIKCDNCAFFDEFAEEQPCCGCVDGCYFVKNELDEETDTAE